MLFRSPILSYLVSLNLEKENFLRTISSIYFMDGITFYSSIFYHGIGNINDL